jgi:GNAT superfamily N-acetyltransferase
VLRIEAVPADGAEARACLDAYFAELAARFPEGFDAAQSTPADARELTPPGGVFLVVRVDGKALGCGALKTLEPGVGEIKRMWIDGSLRGRGVGRQLLAALEDEARTRGHRVVRLDTNATLVEAQALYGNHGYALREPYNDNVYADRWYEKSLDTVADAAEEAG